jgi:gamma-glutamyl:cysteine ligase YbdK (ATP-grasp superfamily)
MDLRAGTHVPATELAERLLDELRPSAAELGCTEALERIDEIVSHGTGADRQLEAAERLDGDLREVVREVVLIDEEALDQ